MTRSSCAALLVATFVLSLDGQANRTVVTKPMVDRWMTELSNWGRWGKDDQRGTLNLVTPERSRRALALAKDGVSVSLSHTYIEQRAEDATSPFGHEVLPIGPGPFVSDRFTIAYHGYAHSHMDSLCHMSHEGRMYNGFARDEVTPEGCAKLAIANFKQGIVARGVLIDVARLKGVKYLEPGTPIYPEDLEAWEKQARVKVGAGDILLVRNGRWARRAEQGAWATAQRGAGLHASALPWLKARDVAMLGSDNVNDVLPSGVEGVAQPIHQVVLVAMGTPLFDNLDLELVAEEAAKRNRWEFLLVASPLAVDTATGSPLNPLAIF
jgi:kynurenine formamidase